MNSFGLTRRAVSLLAMLSAVVIAAPAVNAQGSDEQGLVDKAKLTVENFRRDPELRGNVNSLLARAKGVLVVPSLLKGGFIIGVEGGSGVLLTRNGGGDWSYPAFYTVGSGSIGLQIGAQDAEVLFIIMTDNGLEQVVKNQFKMGADAGVAIGPKGVGVEAATTLNLNADIYSYAKTRGAFAGVSFEGSVVQKRDDWNTRYYGRTTNAREIVIERTQSNPGADGLRQALATR